MERATERLQKALNNSQQRGEHGPLLRLLRRYRREPWDGLAIRNALKPQHRHLDHRFLHPQLLPVELLVDPDGWTPDQAGFHLDALQAAHPDLKEPDHLISSGILNQILRGERPLYDDLPALSIDAYAAELRRSHRAICKREQLSALAHLNSYGRDAFHQGEAVATCLDRYRIQVEAKPICAARRPIQQPWLVVIDAEIQHAIRLGRAAGWDKIVAAQSQALTPLAQRLAELHPDTPVSFCHRSDRLALHAIEHLSIYWHQHRNLALCSSDELIAWTLTDPEAIGNPQCRVEPTAPRLLMRGALGGLITIRAGHLTNLDWPASTNSMHELLVNLTLQLLDSNVSCGHCGESLLIRTPALNPSILDVGSPMERHWFNNNQINAINNMLTSQSARFLAEGGAIQPHPEIPGCQRFRFQPEQHIKVSIIIPFKDNVELTQTCLSSIRSFAGQTEYEVILANNGSVKEPTKEWLSSLHSTKDIKIIDLAIDFNFATINNVARKHCSGNFLLFLNNDIEFQSANILEELLAPFAFKTTGAVGSKLLYPDGATQHQGVVLIRGERRALREPGKSIGDQAILDDYLPLRVEEEVSAASAACLLVRAELFDDVGGFNEAYAVTFNDVDLCLRIRQLGYKIMITPYPKIIHHEGKSRGKDLDGEALARQQREQGLLREHHADLYDKGDPLTSQHLHPHTNHFGIQPRQTESARKVEEKIVYSWTEQKRPTKSHRPLLFFAQFSANGELRSDIIPLLRAYKGHADVVFIGATPTLKQNRQIIQRLKGICHSIIIRDNEGYDFGSWKTGIRFCQEDIQTRNEIILTNDSLWGPVNPLKHLFKRIRLSSADVVGLTDDLMYSYHLQSSFLVFRQKAICSQAFQTFWESLPMFNSKRELVKACEVGLSTLLSNADMSLESIYTKNSNGNVLHFQWRTLIEDNNFPFIKVSLLKENPCNQNIEHWQHLLRKKNGKLLKSIKTQLDS